MCSTILQSYRLFNIPRRKPPTPLPPPLSWGAEDWLAYSSPRITLLHSETFLLVRRHKCRIIFQWWKNSVPLWLQFWKQKATRHFWRSCSCTTYVSAEWGGRGGHSNWVWRKEWQVWSWRSHDGRPPPWPPRQQGCSVFMSTTVSTRLRKSKTKI